MHGTPQDSTNVLLSRLPEEDRRSVLAKSRRVALNLRQPIYPAGGVIRHVYFPEAGMISMVVNLNDGMQAEVGLIGNEGMAGATLLAGYDTSFVEAMVQMTGIALRMSARDFQATCASSEPFRTSVLRYNERRQAQIMQTAACNGRHGLEQRLSRWLLMAHDRAETDDLQLTQEFIAMMLGVHRPSITVTASILQRAGLIRYAPGRITVLDRAGLEASACECYAALRNSSRG